MRVERLAISGSRLLTPQVHLDDRGSFLELFRADRFAELTGYPLTAAQVNFAISRKGALRGVHFADVPPGQGKYITCLRGAVLDVVVDLRVGSPTFGRWEAVQLDENSYAGIYLAEGLGHGYFSLTDEATVAYVCSTPFNPEREHGINPLDQTLDIAWPREQPPLLSAKDSAAPGLDEALALGMLPDYETCLARYREVGAVPEPAVPESETVVTRQ